MEIDLQKFQENYLHKNFIVLYVIVFFFLSFFCAFVKFLGQLPVLIIITFIICVILQNRYQLGKK
jgi:hypothetical protein